jgi:hypothetical protein
VTKEKSSGVIEIYLLSTQESPIKNNDSICILSSFLLLFFKKKLT